ncbi:MAG: hypothetical protein ACI4IN_07780 [Eubacterium sp.]
MKKALGIIMALIVAISAVTAVVLSKQIDHSDTAQNGTKVSQVTTKEITTDSAKVKEQDAISLIESYSSEELGINDAERKECSFLIASNGEKIEDTYYVKVIAAIKTPHKNDGETTYTFDTKGEYYISYDGGTILSKDLLTGEYTQLKTK